MRWLWVPLVALFAFLTVQSAVDGEYVAAIVCLVAGVALLLWLSPVLGSRGGRTQAQVEALPVAQRPVVVYWRPGCPYCLRMRSALGRLGRRAHWVNIWQDPDGAAYVRSVNDGDETVPTVVIDGVAHTNPAPELVHERLAA